MPECELLSFCGFFRKHGESHSPACRLLLRANFRGERQEECRRKEFLRKNGQPPGEDMLPTGEMFSDLVG